MFSAAVARYSVAMCLLLVVRGSEGAGLPAREEIENSKSVIREPADKKDSNSHISTSDISKPSPGGSSLAEEMPSVSFNDDVIGKKPDFSYDASEEQRMNKTLSQMYDLIGSEEAARRPVEEDVAEIVELRNILDFLEEESGAYISPEYYTDEYNQRLIEESITRDNESDTYKKPDAQESSQIVKTRTKRRASQPSGFVSVFEPLNDERKLKRPDSRIIKRDVREMTSQDYPEDDSEDDDNSDGSVEESATERKEKFLDEIRAEKELLEELLSQKRLEKAREAALNELINGLESGEIQLSHSISDRGQIKHADIYSMEKRKQSKQSRPVSIPIVHKGVRGFFIPDFAATKRASEESFYSPYEDEQDQWQAVVPESYRANL